MVGDELIGVCRDLEREGNEMSLSASRGGDLRLLVQVRPIRPMGRRDFQRTTSFLYRLDRVAQQVEVIKTRESRPRSIEEKVARKSEEKVSRILTGLLSRSLSGPS